MVLELISYSYAVMEYGARWPSGLERSVGDRVVLGWNPTAATSPRNFGNSVYPALPVSFGGDTKSRRSLPSGVYARASKRSQHSALEMCNLSWTPPLLEKENSKNSNISREVANVVVLFFPLFVSLPLLMLVFFLSSHFVVCIKILIRWLPRVSAMS